MKAQHQTSLFQVSEIKVSYQPKFRPADRPKINSSNVAYELLINNWNMATIDMTEDFQILLLNRGNKVIGIKEISTGGFAATVADPKLIFSVALKCAASGIICCHNHPSGNLTPSSQDLIITKKLVEAGNMLDLPILDHLIIDRYSYFSFGDEGLI